MPDVWIENRPRRGWGRLRVGEVRRYRPLVLLLALRDLRVRYRQTVFGVLWAMAQPLAGAAIFTVVFAALDRVQGTDSPYPLFAFLGFSVWTYLASSITRSSHSLVENIALVTKVYCPRLCPPLAALLPDLVDLAIALGLFVVLALAFGAPLPPQALAAPLLLVPVMGLALGIGAFLAALYVRYRDVRQVIPVALQLWFFASPVVYPVWILPEGARPLAVLNPAVGLLGAWRWALLGEAWPGAAFWTACGVVLACLLLGLAYFAYADRRFADVI